MPRGVAVFLTSNLDTSEKKTSENVQQCRSVQTDPSGPEEQQQVSHRKSARRRVARDIFLVIEEKRSSRQGRGCNRKKSQTKSKFGHLKVENPNANPRAKRGLLRDMKNEPNYCCNLPVDCNENPFLSETKNHIRSSASKNCVLSNTSATIAPPIRERKNKISIIPKSKFVAAAKSASSAVNPIFLWAKQDDTRIVEVRCEDYDKRNRIRITKTTTGWRAIPRSDTSTSRIVKYFQTPSSLMKLKREICDRRVLEQNNERTADVSTEFLSKTNSSPKALKYKEIAVEGTENSHMIRCIDAISSPETAIDQEAEDNDDPENIITYNFSLNSNEPETTMLQGQRCSQKSIESLEQFSENESQTSQNYSMSVAAKKIQNVNTNSDTYQTETVELRLCPKTGLFSSSTSSEEPASSELDINDSGIHIDMIGSQMNSEEEVPSGDSPNTVVTNLKDLLDDADVLRQCNDNGICESESIDSLVDHECESIEDISKNFITESKTNVNTFQKPNESISFPNDSIDEGIEDNMFSQISSIETGELEEEENDSFFHTLQNNTSTAFERENIKDSIQEKTISKTTKTLNKKAIETIEMPLRNATSVTEGTLSLSQHANASIQKDLSYKTPLFEEAIVGQQAQESVSQCAVTSSSDILHSPRRQDDDVPIVETGTENIKNFILEQFINLNALETQPNITSSKSENQKNMEPVDLGQLKKGKIVPDLTKSTSGLIETVVVIDDFNDEEPAKKKLCSNFENEEVLSNVSPISPASTNIDGDPDPLTQLQLLLRSTQWNVPDPILIPKDRLGAVLASPAREIPLLVTTRPELKLPEAFSYPHIIKNPNILVISMAQLEAILKNKMEIEKTSLQRSTSNSSDDVCPKNRKPLHLVTKPPPPKDLNTKFSITENSSATNNVNSATLAVINQMLWLPFVGQLSQELLSSLKSPNGLQNQFNNFLSAFPNRSSFGLRHMDDFNTTYIKQIPNSTRFQKSQDEETNFQTSPLYLRAINTFQNHIDVMVLQKLVQQQMLNFPDLDQSTATTASSSSSPPSSSSASASSLTSSKKIEQKFFESSPELNSITLNKQRSLKHDGEALLNSSSTTNSCPSTDYNKISQVLNNTLNLQKLSVGKNYAEIEQNKQIKTKPRLTCKSLSNLLEPENRNIRAMSFIDFKDTNSFSILNINSENCSMQQTVPRFANAAFKKLQSEYTSNKDFEKRQQYNKNSERVREVITNKASDLSHMQANSTHPSHHSLYNTSSVTGGGYNSQWNWTTVTAAGE